MFFNISPELLSGSCNGISQAIIGHPLDTIKVLQQNNVNWKKLKFIQLMRGIKYPLYYQIVTKSLCFHFDNKIEIKNDTIRNGIVGLYLSPFAHTIDIFKIYSQNGISIKNINYYDYINYRAFACTIARDMISYSLYIPTFMYMKKNDYSTPVSSGCAGFINWSASYPIDVIRTRQISNNRNTLTESIKMGSLWKGYSTCAFRGVIANIVGFTVYENVLKFLYRNDITK
jgi:hypothetical protein|tara:strand:- start:2200 stop:2886 length:687 start_codon:yes stop_codon:yes gene_type:complete